eukprot:Nk52_evm1s2623 gene=Nk52_evmTU1s2623
MSVDLHDSFSSDVSGASILMWPEDDVVVCHVEEDMVSAHVALQDGAHGLLVDHSLKSTMRDKNFDDVIAADVQMALMHESSHGHSLHYVYTANNEDDGSSEESEELHDEELHDEHAAQLELMNTTKFVEGPHDTASNKQMNRLNGIEQEAGSLLDFGGEEEYAGAEFDFCADDPSFREMLTSTNCFSTPCVRSNSRTPCNMEIGGESFNENYFVNADQTMLPMDPVYHGHEEESIINGDRQTGADINGGIRGGLCEDVLEFIDNGEFADEQDYFNGGGAVPFKKLTKAKMVEDCKLVRHNFHENTSPMFVYLASVVYIKLSQHISQRNITMMLKVSGRLVKDIMRIVKPAMVKGVGEIEADAILSSLGKIYPDDESNNSIRAAREFDSKEPIPDSYAK